MAETNAVAPARRASKSQSASKSQNTSSTNRSSKSRSGSRSQSSTRGKSAKQVAKSSRNKAASSAKKTGKTPSPKRTNQFKQASRLDSTKKASQIPNKAKVDQLGKTTAKNNVNKIDQSSNNTIKQKERERTGIDVDTKGNGFLNSARTHQLSQNSPKLSTMETLSELRQPESSISNLRSVSSLNYRTSNLPQDTKLSTSTTRNAEPNNQYFRLDGSPIDDSSRIEYLPVRPYPGADAQTRPFEVSESGETLGPVHPGERPAVSQPNIQNPSFNNESNHRHRRRDAILGTTEQFQSYPENQQRDILKLILANAEERIARGDDTGQTLVVGEDTSGRNVTLERRRADGIPADVGNGDLDFVLDYITQVACV